MNLTEKLLEIQNLKLKFPKTAQGYNYKYVPLEELWEKLLPELESRGLLISHYTQNKEVVTRIIDKDSDVGLTSSIPLPENLDPQKLGSAITYYRRYNLVQLFNLMTEDDDDGASAKSMNKQAEPITGGIIKGELPDIEGLIGK